MTEARRSPLEVPDFERTSSASRAPAVSPLLPRAGCAVLPISTTATNPKFLFLREIGGEKCLVPFLDEVELLGMESPHWGGTLVIDMQTTITSTLTVPSNFTLAGVGHFGRPLIVDPMLIGPAIRFGANGHSVLRDLRIEGDLDGVNPLTEGLLIEAPLGPIYLDRLLLSRLKYGVRGVSARSVYVTNCTLDGNAVSIELLAGQSGPCSHWRIRDTDFAQGLGPHGIRIGAPAGAEDVLIHGGRIEGNPTNGLADQIDPPKDAIFTGGGFGVCVFGNRLESNGLESMDPDEDNGLTLTAVRVDNLMAIQGSAVRFVGNYASRDYVRPGSPLMPFGPGATLQGKPAPTQTHFGFNSTKEFGSIDDPNPFPLNRFAASEGE